MKHSKVALHLKLKRYLGVFEHAAFGTKQASTSSDTHAEKVSNKNATENVSYYNEVGIQGFFSNIVLSRKQVINT